MICIKLCGLSRPEDIDVANRLHTDYVGFVFAPKSRRYVSPKQASELKQRLAPSIQAVGVFVDENPETILSLLEQGIIDIPQLHGREGEKEIRFLQKAAGRPVIKAFSLHTPQDAALAQESPADLILLDSGPGGTGAAFDWRLLEAISRPYFLAGGLDAETVITALERLDPYGVDVSSGIETQGQKDPAKMEAFVRAVEAVRKLSRKPPL